MYANRRWPPSASWLQQGTIAKLLAEHELKPHRMTYYLCRDPVFDAKMVQVLTSTGKTNSPWH